MKRIDRIDYADARLAQDACEAHAQQIHADSKLLKPTHPEDPTCSR
ncbi:MAG: hypothetical protein U1F35_05290 [Steroidobacteraceae bacterium]